MTKVLVVDDSMYMRRLISDVLAQNSCTVVGEASDGSEALEQYRRLQPEIVFMDIVMPCMDGIEAVRQIRAYDRNARIIMCSCIGQSQHLKEALMAGACEYVTKPFRPENLARALETAAHS